jgi:hypothetical protein
MRAYVQLSIIKICFLLRKNRRPASGEITRFFIFFKIKLKIAWITSSWGYPGDLFNVSLLRPIDAYKLSDPATKYGILFGTDLCWFFLFDMMKHLPIHPVRNLKNLAKAINSLEGGKQPDATLIGPVMRSLRNSVREMVEGRNCSC